MSQSATLAAAPVARTAERLDGPLASVVLGLAALLGVVGDALLSNGITGIAFPILAALAAMTLVALAWRAELVVTREAGAWLMVAVACSIGMAWRESEMLQFLNFCGTLGGLLLAAATVNRAGSVLFAPKLVEAVAAVIHVVRKALPGIFPLVFSEAPQRVDSGRALLVARVALVVVPLVLIFGALLRGADPIFASLTAIPALDAELIAQHTIVTAVLCAAAGGWARAALLPKATDSTSSINFGRLGALEINAGLGTLNVLFAAFVLTQLGWFFGGEEFLRARTGLTAAEYARSGFFQMVMVVALVVPLLVASRLMLAQGRALARRHTMLSLPIVALLGMMILSAALRMKLYVHYFGLSTDRLYPLVFMLWLGVVLAWLSMTVLRGWNRPFLAGVALSAFATLVGLNVSAPDRIVATVNVERARTSTERDSLDVLYLSRLGGEAADVAVRAVLPTPAPTSSIEQRRSRCYAVRNLLDRWGPSSSSFADWKGNAAWRTWNAGNVNALNAVQAHAARLQTIRQGECAEFLDAKTQR
jgi:hypothetical protein